MEIILWIIFGGLVGWVASLIMETDGEQGLALNVVVGVIGAVIGGWLMSFIGVGDAGLMTMFSYSFNLYSFAVAVLGSVVLIGLIKTLRLA